MEALVNKIAVHWFAPFFSGGGYCSEAISFAVSITDRGIPLRIEQHGDSVSQRFLNSLPDDLLEELVDLTHTDISSEPVVTICHSEPGAWKPSRWAVPPCPTSSRTDYLVGRTMFETDRLPEGWTQRLNKMDQVWVPTQFAKDIFIENGVKEEKLRILGETVDVDYFNPKGVEPYFLEDAKEECFVFLSVFKWEDRKGWDILLKAYFNQFNVSDKVLLVLLTNEYHSRPGFRGFRAEIDEFAENNNFDTSTLPQITLLTGLTQDELRSLYRAVDVFVLPSRGEGWGRPHVEAMAMELPIIATNWSGPTEYMTDSNSYPLKIEGLIEVQNGPFQGHMWANPSVTHLRELLQRVHDDKEEANRKGQRARQTMVDKFSPAILGGQVERLLMDIQDELFPENNGQSCNSFSNEHNQCSQKAATNSVLDTAGDISGFILRMEFIDFSLVFLFIWSFMIIVKKILKAIRILAEQ